MKENTNYLFLLLGLFSIILSIFDFLIETDLYGGLLAIAWGLLFIFLSFRKVTSMKNYSALLGVIIIFVLVSVLLKLLDKLDVI